MIPEGLAVIGVGLDLVEVERIQASHERHGARFLDRIYTEFEQHYCMKMKNPYPHLAARFAAKEAISKAFGTGIGAELDWTSMAVQKDANDAPLAVLDAKAELFLRQKGGKSVLISLTHTKALAQAIAIIV